MVERSLGIDILKRGAARRAGGRGAAGGRWGAAAGAGGARGVCWRRSPRPPAIAHSPRPRRATTPAPTPAGRPLRPAPALRSRHGRRGAGAAPLRRSGARAPALPRQGGRGGASPPQTFARVRGGAWILGGGRRRARAAAAGAAAMAGGSRDTLLGGAGGPPGPRPAQEARRLASNAPVGARGPLRARRLRPNDPGPRRRAAPRRPSRRLPRRPHVRDCHPGRRAGGRGLGAPPNPGAARVRG